MALKLVRSNRHPRKSRVGMMTAAQHQRRAAELRKSPSAKAQEIALGHEQAARMIEQRGKLGM